MTSGTTGNERCKDRGFSRTMQIFRQLFSYAHDFSALCANMVETIQEATRLDAHPTEEGHNPRIVVERVGSVHTGGVAEADRLVMGYAVADVVDVVEFQKYLGVVYLGESRRLRFIGKNPKEMPPTQAVLEIVKHVLPYTKLHFREQF